MPQTRPSIFAKLSLAFLAAIFWAGAANAAPERDGVTIAVIPCGNAVAAVNKFNPLMQYLKKETGFNVNLAVPITIDYLESGLRLKDIDFVLASPHVYIALADLFDRNSLLRSLTSDGSTSEAGLIVVRKDSGITKIEDLKGKTIMFGPKLASNKFFAALLLFRSKDIDIDQDLQAYSYGGCCEDIVFSVFLKKVDAGVTCDHFLDHPPETRSELGITYEELTVIETTKPVPTRVFVARSDMAEDITRKINQALLRLNIKNAESEHIFQSCELGGFQEAKDSDYDDLRAMLNLLNTRE